MARLECSPFSIEVVVLCVNLGTLLWEDEQITLPRELYDHVMFSTQLGGI